MLLESGPGRPRAGRDAIDDQTGAAGECELLSQHRGRTRETQAELVGVARGGGGELTDGLDVRTTLAAERRVVHFAAGGEPWIRRADGGAGDRAGQQQGRRAARSDSGSGRDEVHDGMQTLKRGAEPDGVVTKAVPRRQMSWRGQAGDG